MPTQFDFLSFVELHPHLRVPADRLGLAAHHLEPDAAYGVLEVIASVAQYSYSTVGQQK
ncbi:hypothetical protein FHS32_007018 [Streptomyces albaduncus]|uniref:Uncharacterized protein n=1 Tax=Streptomyces griseoloalbus TaxID=67303 RepID=A0A7W8BVB9_9ACTN|nr:hypothetical protein [Streptomyces albaduncus]MBB5130221.1 hypothetical protein [Streptomyces albaduncus]